VKKKKMTRLTGVNRVLDYAALGVVILTIVYLLSVYPTLPTKLPTHVDFKGNISYGHKSNVWISVPTQIVMYVVFAISARIPSVYENPNVPWQVKRSAKKELGKYTIMLLCVCNIECCAMFGIMAVQLANGAITGVAASCIIMAVVIVVTITALLIKMYKVSKKEPWEL